ncbi:hypothetical protein BZG36_01929 [Bifiguratus adelaidae]|uniref:CID domain-containing protein n=1 Tax=Bifiguratus adelaidae TaxID=1938954 RepID=A0A261Y3V8_9FUNG|nr:hypothetical protein BZG36_01929 [Bifiguratus adelaidae]
MADPAEFERELFALVDGKLPVSASKIQNLSKLAQSLSQYFKHVVVSIQSFLYKAPPEYKLAGIYVIDAISKIALDTRRKREKEGLAFGEGGKAYMTEAYLPRIENMFVETRCFERMTNCSDKDKDRIIKTLDIWDKSGLYSHDVLQKAKDTLKMSNSGVDGSTASPYKDKEGTPLIGSTTPPIPPPGWTGPPAGQSSFDAVQLLANLTSLAQGNFAGIAPAVSASNNATPAPPTSSGVPHPLSFNYEEDDRAPPSNETPPQPSSAPPLGDVNAIQAIIQQAGLLKAGQTLPQPNAGGMAGSNQTMPPVTPISNMQPPQQPPFHPASNAMPPFVRQDAPPHMPPPFPIPNHAPHPPPSRPQDRNDGRGDQDHHKKLPKHTGMVQKDLSLPPGHIRVLTRTIFVGPLPPTMTKERLKEMFSIAGPVFGVVLTQITPAKQNAFIKFVSRQSAQKAKDDNTVFAVDGMPGKVGWAYSFGPKSFFDYNTGESVIPLARLSDDEKLYMTTAAIGGYGDTPLQDQITIEEPQMPVAPKDARGGAKDRETRHEPVRPPKRAREMEDRRGPVENTYAGGHYQEYGQQGGQPYYDAGNTFQGWGYPQGQEVAGGGPVGAPPMGMPYGEMGYQPPYQTYTEAPEPERKRKTRWT